MLTYKGYAVYYDNGLYHIGQNPTAKYLTFQDCKNEIDRIEKTLEDNILNLSTIIKRNLH